MNGNNNNGNIDFLMGNPGQGGSYGNNYGYNNYQQNPMMNQNMYNNNSYNNPYSPMNQNGFNNGMDNMNNQPNQVNSYVSPTGRDYSMFDVEQLDSNTNNDPNKNETLFGVPMYDNKKEEKKIDESNLFATSPSSFNSNTNNMYQTGNNYGGFGAIDNMPPITHNNGIVQKENETLFGVPMYEDNNKPPEVTDGTRTDIFGQLLTPDGNMRIKGGRIVDDFSKVNVPPQDGNLIQQNQANSGFPGISNFSNFNANEAYSYQGASNPILGDFGNTNNYGVGQSNGYGAVPQNNYGMGQNQGFGMNQNNYGMNQPAQGYGMNQGYGNNFQNMSYGNNFGNMGYNGYGQNMQMGYNGYGPMGGLPGYGMPMQRGPIFNELKVEDNLNQNIIRPEELEAEENPDKKPTPRVDLNLETGSKDDEKYYE